MSATNTLSSTLIPGVPVRNDWRGRMTEWLARMAARRQRRAEEAVSMHLANRPNRDLRLPPGPSHDDSVWGAVGLISR